MKKKYSIFIIYKSFRVSSCFLLLMLMPIFMYSQQVAYEECILENPATSSNNNYNYITNNQTNNINDFDNKTFNIYYWQVRKNVGSDEYISTEEIINRHNTLNQTYNELGICFKMTGIGYIDNPTYYYVAGNPSNFPNKNPTPVTPNTLIVYAKNNGYFKNDAINIYFSRTLDFGGVSGYYSNHVVTNSNAGTFMHEVGHTLNLRHTFGNSNYRPDPNDCESITRNENDSEYNANIAGDQVGDTNAVPNFHRQEHNYMAKAIEAANIGYSFFSARNIALEPNGFGNYSDASAIEQALLDYGFTQVEVNYLKHNSARDYAYMTNCTYSPGNRANDPSTPMFKNCNGEPYTVTSDDTQNLMAYVPKDCKNILTEGQGIRIHQSIENPNNSNKLVMNALVDNSLDLTIRNSTRDIGLEPDITSGNVLWKSPDIWVRNQPDGITHQEHQNPEYDPNNPVYVYVRITNNSCEDFDGNGELKLHWAKANTSANWPAPYDGSINNPVLLGDVIDEKPISVINAGESIILSFEWSVPNPDDYQVLGIYDNPWHFCLLARILSTEDPMTFPEAPNQNIVYRNNNIASKNVNITTPEEGGLNPGGNILVGNLNSNSIKTYKFELEDVSTNSKILNEAEVILTMDAMNWNKWNSGGQQGKGVEIFNPEEKQLIITKPHAEISNMSYNPSEWGVMDLSFHFLTQEVTDQSYFEYQILQKDMGTQDIISGESYEIYKNPREFFEATGEENSYNTTQNSVTFNADDIGEPAKYKWYDPKGNKIHEGKNLTLSSNIEKEYKLEVTAESDGYRDYGIVEVSNSYYSINLAPNPTSNFVNVSYFTSLESSYLRITSINDLTSNNYTIDETENEIQIDVSNYPTGLYTVALISNEEVVSSKLLSIN